MSTLWETVQPTLRVRWPRKFGAAVVRINEATFDPAIHEIVGEGAAAPPRAAGPDPFPALAADGPQARPAASPPEPAAIRRARAKR